MKLFKSFLLPAALIFLISASTAGVAQQKAATMSFDNLEHNFGDIEEEAGPVSHTFRFRNTGSIPLIIHDVKSSCGCTTPSYSKQPVLPGAEGYIKATYDPKNRPHGFEKAISIKTNAEPADVVLKIKGNVIPRDKGLEELYPFNVNGIRLKSNHISFTKLNNNQKDLRSVEIINDTDSPLKLGFNDVPEYIHVKAEPTQLAPGEKGRITATYDASQRNAWGYVIDRLRLSVNGQIVPGGQLTITANIQEDFSKLTSAERQKAAKIAFNDTEFNFGDIKQGEKVEHTFRISNKGKSDLVIRDVKASCGCTAVKPDKNIIKPGETTSMKAIFNSAGKTGRQNKTISIITNSPDQPRSILWIKGNVIE